MNPTHIFELPDVPEGPPWGCVVTYLAVPGTAFIDVYRQGARDGSRQRANEAMEEAVGMWLVRAEPNDSARIIHA